MDANCDTHPGDAEAAGAVAGMQETYGRPLPEVGDWVAGTSCGRAFSGEVLQVNPMAVHVLVGPERGTYVIVRRQDID